MLAASYSFPDIFKILLEAGADYLYVIDVQVSSRNL